MKLSVIKLITWIVLLNIPFSLSAKEVLTWRVIDWPPFYILDGADKGQGLYDQLIKKIADALPEYQHRTMVMNTKRVLAELENGSHVCHPSALGDTIGVLSKTNSLLLPYRIIYDTEDKPEFAQYESIALAAILQDKNYHVGIASDRYSSKLNNILAKHKGENNLINQNNYNSLIRMFFSKRIDALIEYPPVINYSKRLLDNKISNSSIAIKELSASKFLPVYIACPNNEWGKAVIEKINAFLVKESLTEDYLAYRLRWYDEESQKLLKRFYQKHYLLDKRN